MVMAPDVVTVTIIQLIVPLVVIGIIKAKRIPDW
jgi:hypothetical protein